MQDSMSLADDIESDVSAIFLQTGDFATTITHYPLGDQSNGATITAIVDKDLLDGAGSRAGGAGVGDDLRSDNGAAIKEQAYLELSVDVEITPMRDTFAINGELWIARRIKEIDDGMQTVLIQRTLSKTVRRTQTNTG